jgi:hypothetical protein
MIYAHSWSLFPGCALFQGVRLKAGEHVKRTAINVCMGGLGDVQLCCFGGVVRWPDEAKKGS